MEKYSKKQDKIVTTASEVGATICIHIVIIAGPVDGGCMSGSVMKVHHSVFSVSLKVIKTGPNRNPF